jgi:argininosuccinate lyase
LPLTEQEFREVISAEYMVFGRRGLGGPQVAEMQQALSSENQQINALQNWLILPTEKLEQAQSNREKLLGRLSR